MADRPSLYRKALPEFCGMLGILVGVGFVFTPEDPFFHETHPHPLWILILLMAIRYGSPVGGGVGFVSGLLYLLSGFYLHQYCLQEAFQLGSADLVRALLMVVVGGAIGEAIASREGKAEYLRGEIRRARQEVEEERLRRGEIEQAYRKLEARIAGQSDTMIALYESARHLESLEIRDIYRGLIAILQEYLGVERCSIWELQPDRRFSRIVPEEEKKTTLSRLGWAVVREGRVVTARELFQDQKVLPEEGVMAGPLKVKEEIVALVIVESMRFAGFTPTAVKLFSILLEWSSRSLANAILLQEAKNQQVYDREIGLLTPAFLQTRADQEVRLAFRRKSTASLLVCRIAGRGTAEVLRRFVIVFARLFQRMTRTSDAVAYWPEKRSFVLFLPDAPREGAEVLRKKIQGAIESFHFSSFEEGGALRLVWGVATLAEGKTFATLLEEAMQKVEAG